MLKTFTKELIDNATAKDYREILSVPAGLTIQCKTKEEASKFLAVIELYGYEWNNGDKIDPKTTYWGCHEGKRCYSLHENSKITLSDKCQNAISFSQFMNRYVLPSPIEEIPSIVCIQCTNYRDAKKLLFYLDEMGYKWSNGESLKSPDDYWGKYLSRTVYCINNKLVQYGTVLKITPDMTFDEFNQRYILPRLFPKSSAKESSGLCFELGTAVNCKNEGEAEAVLEYLKQKGYKIWDANNESVKSTRWNTYKRETCYLPIVTATGSKYIALNPTSVMSQKLANVISYRDFEHLYMKYEKESQNTETQITLEDALRILSDALYSKLQECAQYDSKKKQGMCEAYADSYRMFADLLKDPVEFTKQKRAELEKTQEKPDNDDSYELF